MENSKFTSIKTTPLDEMHRDLGARMVPFAGYAMPVQYDSIIAEHKHTREAAALFDLSHMGQAILHGPHAAAAFEKIVPAEIQELSDGQQRYTMMTNDQGGILDDLMVARVKDSLHLVVNASCKDNDFSYIKAALGKSYELEILIDRALLALQGPAAATIIDTLSTNISSMTFMSVQHCDIQGIPCFISRSGYTGEDGFEISVKSSAAEQLARALLEEPNVKPAGLGARDSLRLEAGLCLYGNDIDQQTTPVEAGLSWTIGKRRRAEGRFPGDSIIQQQIESGVTRKRVGLQPEGRTPVRAHSEILDTSGKQIGEVTSGGFGPSINTPIAMGYISSALSGTETPIQFSQRGKIINGTVCKLPFVKHQYFKS
jgi:aminomethyltransferase